MSIRLNPLENVFVIFSSFSEPRAAAVQKSLRKFSDETFSIVMTSPTFAKNWKFEVDKVFVTKLSVHKSIKKLVKVSLNRSSFLRKALHFLINKHFYSFRWILMPPHNSRHFESLRVVESLPNNSWVFLVDSRDLVFQKSPVEVASKLKATGDIHFFDERSRNFKNGGIQKNEVSVANWNWTKMLLNYELSEANKLRDEWIINSGCISGTKQAVEDFLKKSCSKLSESLYSNTDLLDQASTNYVVYNKELNSNCLVHENGEIVLNMCGKINQKIEVIEGSIFICGEKVPIIHQYDRFGGWDSEHGFSLNKRNYNSLTDCS